MDCQFEFGRVSIRLCVTKGLDKCPFVSVIYGVRESCKCQFWDLKDFHVGVGAGLKEMFSGSC